MTPALGLHARPAARFVGAVSEFDARVEVSNATRSRGPADARSLTGIATLGVRQGDEIVVRASGEQAAEVLDAVRALAADNFGDPPETARGAAGARPRPRAAARPQRDGGRAARARPRPRAARRPDRPATARRPHRGGAPAAPGTRLRGIPASAGIAIGPARRLHPQEPPVDAEPAGLARRGASAARRRARRRARRTSRRRKATVAARAGGAEAEIFTAHALLLDDTALTGPAHDRESHEARAPAGRGRRPGRRRRPRSARSTTRSSKSAPSTSRTSRAACWRGSPGRPPAPRSRARGSSSPAS